MSEATQVLLTLVTDLSRQRLKFPNLQASGLAIQLVRRLSAEEKDAAVASCRLNRDLFLREASDPERRLMHEIVIKAVEEFQNVNSEKKVRNGSYRR